MITLLGVVRVEFFDPVFPFSRFPVVKTPLVLTNHRTSTGLREYGQRVFLTQGVKKTREPVQKNPFTLISTCTVYKTVYS